MFKKKKKDCAQSINIEQDNLFNNWPVSNVWTHCLLVCLCTCMPSSLRSQERASDTLNCSYMVKRPCGYQGLSLVLCWTISPAQSKFYTSRINVWTCDLPLRAGVRFRGIWVVDWFWATRWVLRTECWSSISNKLFAAISLAPDKVFIGPP